MPPEGGYLSSRVDPDKGLWFMITSDRWGLVLVLAEFMITSDRRGLVLV